MAFKLISASEPVKAEALCTVLFGEPGIGKTSLSFTSSNSLLMDFDKGLKRCVGRKTAVSFDNWEDANLFLKSDDFRETGTKTLIIDTAGTMLDNFVAGYVTRQDPKNAKGGGELSLQGYGAMKSVFKQFVNQLKAMNIDIVFIAHADQVKDGDNLKFQPKMTGGSYSALIEVADMVGYIENNTGKRTVDFNPTQRHVGKNTAEFPILEIPHYTTSGYDTFLADLIEKTKSKMSNLTEAQIEAANKVKRFRAEIDLCMTPDELDLMLPSIQELDKTSRPQIEKYHADRYKAIISEWTTEVDSIQTANQLLDIINQAPIGYQKALKVILWTKAKEMGYDFNKEEATFFVPDPQAAADFPLVNEVLPELKEDSPEGEDGVIKGIGSPARKGKK
jgi:hypothetical protein